MEDRGLRHELTSRLVLVDRDGTLIEDCHYLGESTGVRLLPGVGEALQRLNRAGWPVALVTNQSGLGRRYFSLKDYHSVHGELVRQLAVFGARLDAHEYCPHAPGQCSDCRKPASGMFYAAARKLGRSLAGAVFIGDRLRDLMAAPEVGGTAWLVEPQGLRESRPLPYWVHTASGFPEVVDHLLARF